jgi:hypothetical protein
VAALTFGDLRALRVAVFRVAFARVTLLRAFERLDFFAAI